MSAQSKPEPKAKPKIGPKPPARHPTLVLGMKGPVLPDSGMKRPAKSIKAPSAKEVPKKTAKRAPIKKTRGLSPRRPEPTGPISVPKHRGLPPTAQPAGRSSLPGKLAPPPSPPPSTALSADNQFSFTDDDISMALSFIGPGEKKGITAIRPAERPISHEMPPPIRPQSKPQVSNPPAPPPASAHASIQAKVDQEISVPILDITLELEEPTHEAPPPAGPLPAPVIPLKRLSFSRVVTSLVSLMGIVSASVARIWKVSVPIVAGSATGAGRYITHWLSHVVRFFIKVKSVSRETFRRLSTRRRLAPSTEGFKPVITGRNRLNYRVAAIGVGALLTGSLFWVIGVFVVGEKGGENRGKSIPPNHAAAILPGALQSVSSDGIPSGETASAKIDNDSVHEVPETESSATSPKAITAHDAALVTITLKGVQEGTEIYVDGEPTEMPIVLPRSKKAVKIEAVLEGFKTAVKRVVPGKDKTVSMRMRKKGEGNITKKRHKGKRRGAPKPKSEERQKRLASNPFGS